MTLPGLNVNKVLKLSYQISINSKKLEKHPILSCMLAPGSDKEFDSPKFQNSMERVGNKTQKLRVAFNNPFLKEVAVEELVELAAAKHNYHLKQNNLVRERLTELEKPDKDKLLKWNFRVGKSY